MRPLMRNADLELKIRTNQKIERKKIQLQNDSAFTLLSLVLKTSSTL
jgi:hypothetical protein